MKNISFIKELIKTANHLDKKGLHKEADAIDKVIQKIAQDEVGPKPEVTPPPLPDQYGPGLYTKLSYSKESGDTKRYAITDSRLAEFDYSNPAAAKFVKYIDDHTEIINTIIAVLNDPQVWNLKDSLSADRARDKEVFLRIYKDTQRKASSEKSGAPEPASSVPKQIAIPRGTRGYIDLPGDNRYAYQLGTVGTISYKAFDRVTGKLLGILKDQAGYDKVVAAMEAKATSAFPR